MQLDVVDPTPHVIIWPGEGAERLDDLQFGQAGGPARAWWVYPVMVVMITSGNRIVETGFSAYMDVREAVRNILFRPMLGGIAQVFDCDIAPKDVFDLTAFVKGNYDVTGWEMYYKSAETLSA